MEAEILVSIASRPMADALLAATFPGMAQTEVKKYTTEYETVFHVAVRFASDVGVALLAQWLYDAIKKPGHEKTKIEDRPIPQNLVQIQTLIINEIQRSKSDQPPNKKTHENGDSD